MSSADESAGPISKKRKVQRACDHCRNKKTKCDGTYMPNNLCSHCAKRSLECTYLQGNENGYSRNYVENLEGRLERMEKLISKLYPDIDTPKGLDGHTPDNDGGQSPTPALERSRASGSRIKAVPITPPMTIGFATPRTVNSSPHSDEEDGESNDELTEGMQKLSMGSQPFRYHGKSSGLVFMKSAWALKEECAGPRPALPKEDEEHPWLTAFVEDDFPLLDERSFPPQDLMDVLVDLYFRHINCHLPLLHEPTFKSAIKAGLHLLHGGFGATVLLVCANGSRFTRDPRVLLGGSHHPHSAGWKWFSLVDKARRLSFAPAKLHDLQVYVLIALFLQGTAAPHANWAVIGAGIRAGVEVGAHRRKMYAPTPTVEEELWRRAFWILVILEWVLGYGLGRPCSIHDEDLDLPLPTECDDEYWLTPEGEPLFKQPPGKPSKMSGFIYSLRLAQLLAFATRTIYASTKSRIHLGHSDEQWEQRVVVELDSALNKWAESLPSHLRWDSEKEDAMFLTQAATLKANYYSYQITIHRSFTLSSSHRPSPLSSIICTNAARSSIQVLDVLYMRTGSPYYGNMGILLTSGTILMVNILGLKRSGQVVNVDRDLDLVRRVVDMLRSLRYEMQVAESLAEMLTEMMSAINARLPDEVHTPAGSAQGRATTKGTKRPSSPAALSIEGPLHEQHAQCSQTSQQAAADDAAETASLAGEASFASPASAHPDSILHIPPGFEFLLSNPSPFALESDGFGPAAPGLAVPLSGSAPGSTEHLHPRPPPVFTRPYGSLPQQPPLQLQHSSSSTPAGFSPASGEGPFFMSDQYMFGLGPPGYDLSESRMASLSSNPQVGAHGAHAQTQHYFAHMALPSGSSRADGGLPDFALMDDGQMFRPSFPPGVESEGSWGEYFANANNVRST